MARERPALWAEASRVLVDAAIAAGAALYVQPTVTFVSPPQGPLSETTPIAAVPPTVPPALATEPQTARFAAAGGRGVVLRLGLLDRLGTGNDAPEPELGATLHVHDAARVLLAAPTLPSGIYNVCRDGERVSNHRFTKMTMTPSGGAPCSRRTSPVR